ncbi:DUF3099 domain-containing protein [Falsarthrobacter nasiphocae]|uniref:DUF3099 domain-containing protein n=1 Tax=Falsarthrobacter nasiphocae TaxID=189863 RepID=A0AAE3YDF3_9MICC|nr:DUF3099 domain-containing protein [Falsarthrobacter nasiphocae]MDR6891135.1 hypothetical protein [Falsarthrobacter nasiphocae]
MRRSRRSAESSGSEEYLITRAPRSHADDLHRRRRNYIISMSTRFVLLAMLFFVPRGWPMVLVIVAMAVIPYVAVVLANAGAEMTSREPMAEYEGLGLAAPTAPDPAATPDGLTEPSDDQVVIVQEPEAPEPRGASDDAAGAGQTPAGPGEGPRAHGSHAANGPAQQGDAA